MNCSGNFYGKDNATLVTPSDDDKIVIKDLVDADEIEPVSTVSRRDGQLL